MIIINNNNNNNNNNKNYNVANNKTTSNEQLSEISGYCYSLLATATSYKYININIKYQEGSLRLRQ